MQLPVDLRTLDPQQGTAVFWLGKVPVQISYATMKSVKDNAQLGYLELGLTALDGEYKGQTHPARFNTYHSNEQTVQIAFRQIASIGWCTGKVDQNKTIQDTDELVGGQFLAEFVKQAPPNDKYSNYSKAYYMNGAEPSKDGPVMMNGAAGATTQQQQMPANAAPAQAPVGTSGAVPWGQPAQAAPASNGSAPWGGAQTSATSAVPWGNK